jgi:GDPmannose 4,6-dehydratase
VARIKAGKQDCLFLGNLNAVRDWVSDNHVCDSTFSKGHSKDYTYGMWLMLQQDTSDDFVIGTGVAHSVRRFVELAFSVIGVTVIWNGNGSNEVGINEETGNIIVRVDEKYYRPAEVDFLLSDPSKAKEKLGWSPKITFEEMVKEMVESDIRLLAEGKENE